MKRNIKGFESGMEVMIENLFETIKSKEKMVEVQDRMIKLKTVEIEKLKVKLYANALLGLQQQPMHNSILKVNK